MRYHHGMVTIEVSSARGGYDVVVEPGALGRLGVLCSERSLGAAAAVVTNTTVGPLWALEVARALRAPVDELPDGERHKEWPAVQALCARWLERRLHRAGLVVAIGGGVVTDTVGFAAAVYLRGIPWVAVPTTLLGMVDAAIGGKTGVNLPQGKNLVGAFWPPRLVVVDVMVLATLPGRELRAGLAEVDKSAWIGDHGLLELVPERVSSWSALAPARWQALVAGAAAVKARVVSADEHEAGPRQALNLGHTLGHALETATGYERFLHGEAVAWGMAAVAAIARRRGLLSRTAASGSPTMVKWGMP